LHVATHEILVTPLWVPLVKVLRRVAPKVEVRLSTVPQVKELERRLSNHSIDLAIGVEFSANPVLHRVALFEDGYGFYATPKRAPGFRAAVKRAGLSAAAAKQSFIFLADAIAGPTLRLGRALEDAGLSITPAYSVESFESVVAVAAAGLAIAILPTVPFES